MAYWNKYNMLNAKKEEAVSENCLLYQAEYIIFNIDKNNAYKGTRAFFNFVNECEVEPGLYNQHPVPMDGHTAYMSHDNLTGLVAASYVLNMPYHHLIWKWITSHGFTYDNVNKRFNYKRILHIRDIIFYGYCADNFICKLLMPILHIIMFISSYQKYKVRRGQKIIKTDGKLLNWVRCTALEWKFTEKILLFIMRKSGTFYNWREVFEMYFRFDKNHPMLKLIRS